MVNRGSVTQLGFLCALTCVGGQSLRAAPPVPVFSDTEPGLKLLFSGDPDTTESSMHDPGDVTPSLDCARYAPRAGSGGEGGKLHNDFLYCDNWDFGTENWGQTGFLQGAFMLGQSPYSSDGAWVCDGNTGPGGNNPCVNATIRAVPTFKNQPAPGIMEGIPMRTDVDWVVSVDFKVDNVPGDTFGGDKLFSLGTLTDGPETDDFFLVTGANNDHLGAQSSHDHREASSYLNGESNRYKLMHGPVVNGMHTETVIPGQIFEGKMTLHYKASNQRLDFWIDQTMILADFEGASGFYDLNSLQLGGGGISFENVLFDNIMLGVVGDTGACGAQGPDTSMPGDFNCDGVVDVADLGIVGANFNVTQVPYIDGDANLDGRVDVADLGVVGANWSAAQGGSLPHALQSAGLAGLVPEPATLTALALALVCLGKRRC